VQTGEIRNRRTLVKVPSELGIPDGLTVDAEGFLWCAHWFGSGLFRYDPDGKLERHIPVPATQTSSMTFGGPDLTDLFITSAGTPDALALAPAGYCPETVYSGGRLFSTNLEIHGRPEYLAKISLPEPVRA
jgi:D-xylonolactonase